VTDDGRRDDQAPAPSSRTLEPRPWLERIGLAAIAAVMGGLLTVMAVAAGSGGEWILAAMSGSGALLTFGVGLATLIRG
jgi:hypothetical protein